MKESFYEKWLSEDVDDINKAISLYGIYGVLEQFENWLEYNGYLILDKDIEV